MNELIKEKLEENRKREDDMKKFPPDFPEGKEIAPCVYQQDGFIIIGDKL